MTAEVIRQYFRNLSGHVRRPTRLNVGGAVSLILPGLLSRPTQYIDVVDEVPAEIREQHPLLDELAARYQLYLTHFQSHYLPSGWANRVHTLEPFGRLEVSRVDEYDVFLGKLFSARTKDLDDLRMLLPQLDRGRIETGLRERCTSLLADPLQRRHAETNWYVLTGDALASACLPPA